MNTRRPQPMDRDTAERLLDGQAPAAAGLDTVAHLLAMATAPAHPDELRGEPAAVARFRVARLNATPPQRRPSVVTAVLTKLLALKFAGTLGAAGAAGGLALAMGTGTIPNPLAGGTTERYAGPGHPAGQPSRPSATAPATSAPTSYLALCRAYRAEGGDNPAVLDTPPFKALVRAAGGKDKVAAYCDELLSRPARTPGATPESGQTPPDPSTHRPTDAPTTRGSEAPTRPPTGAPDDHPTGAPTDPARGQA